MTEPLIALYAYSLVNLNKKNLLSTTPLKAALKALIFALNASAEALVVQFTK